MKVTRVVKSQEVKINLGNYETAGFRTEYEAEVEDGDSPEEVAQTLSDMCAEGNAEDIEKFGVE